MYKPGFAIRRLVPVVVVVALLVFALLAAGAKANPPSATLSFVGTATLLSDPGSVNVTLHYSCLPPSPGFIDVELDEEGTATGGDVVDATCDGKNHSITVTVFGLFTPGTAAGRADITNGSGGAIASTTASINIK